MSTSQAMNIECYGKIKRIPVPNSYIPIEELKNIVRSKLNIDYPFRLTYRAAELCDEDSLHDLHINSEEVVRVRRCSVENLEYIPDSMTDIYLSYEQSDRSKITELKKELEQRSYFSWFDVEQLSNQDLNHFCPANEQGISRSPVFLCCITNRYVLSTKCQQELRCAKENGKKIIILLMEDVHWPPSQIKSLVSGLSYIQFYHDATSPSSTLWPSEKFNELLKKLADFAPQK